METEGLVQANFSEISKFLGLLMRKVPTSQALLRVFNSPISVEDRVFEQMVNLEASTLCEDQSRMIQVE